MAVLEASFQIMALQRYIPFIAAFVVLVVLFELSRIPKRLKTKAEFSHLSGRMKATIIDRHQERTLTYRSTDPEENDRYEYRTMVTYQFEVDGQTYTGEGEGSGAFWQSKEQMICYDPNDPSDNCTLFYYNSKTKSHFLQTLIFVVVILGVFYLAIVMSGKLVK